MIAAANFNLASIRPCPSSAHSKRSHKPPSGLPPISHVEPTSLTSQGRRRCELFELYKERVPYEEAWNWQKSTVKERKMLIEKNEDWSDTVIILQHHPVFTMGTASSQENLKFDINDSPYPVYRTERGGEVTYHGPGQMDLHWYLRAMEEVVIRVLSSTFSIKASRLEGLTGVWVGDQKLAAIGIRVAKWITYHGLALNVTANLAPFEWIVPCGIRNRRVGSIKCLLKGFQSTDESVITSSIYHGEDHHLIDITYKSLVKEFSEVFQLEVYQQPDKKDFVKY